MNESLPMGVHNVVLLGEFPPECGMCHGPMVEYAEGKWRHEGGEEAVQKCRDAHAESARWSLHIVDGKFVRMRDY